MNANSLKILRRMADGHQLTAFNGWKMDGVRIRSDDCDRLVWLEMIEMRTRTARGVAFRRYRLTPAGCAAIAKAVQS